MTKILVTGGTGYIGSHTVVELLQNGYEVVIIDNLENSFSEVLDSIFKITGKQPAFYNLDLRNCEETFLFFSEHVDIDAVIHFAAYKAVGESMQIPLEYYQNNIISLLNLLQGIKNTTCNKLVFSSSCSVYGEPEKLPVDEKTPAGIPKSPYANTKKICEEILSDICKTSDLQSISLRYFNPIGAHNSLLLGELPIGTPNNLIPYITQTAAGLRKQLTVFGNDYNTPDGSCVRDYIHVVDVAKAHVKAVSRLLQNQAKSNNEVFNLGTGEGLSVLEIIKAFEKFTGISLNYTIGPRRPGDVDTVYADTNYANAELGWKTEEGLESMIVSAWKWQQNIPSLFPSL